MAWIALKLLQGKPSWIQCYLVSKDDIEIRTPYGSMLHEKVVSIVGAGSLGSIVSTSLAQEGVHKFNLFDYDTYEPSNAIRHQVSQYWFGLSKVNGVSERIKELSPTAKVEVYNVAVGLSKGQESYQIVSDKLTNSDIVVDTTGEHNLFVSGILFKCFSNKVLMPIALPMLDTVILTDFPSSFLNFSQNSRISSNTIWSLLFQSTLSFTESDFCFSGDVKGNRNYSVKHLKNPALEDCEVCYENH